jgi:hypothetical protein
MTQKMMDHKKPEHSPAGVIWGMKAFGTESSGSCRP